MPEVKISIGGREFEVSCQAGEEHFLKSAAGFLDAEATALTGQIGRLPENRMLLMAGLMLADKTAGVEEQLRALEEKLAVQDALLAELRAQPKPAPERVEVPVIPASVSESMAELAAQAESMADALDEKLATV